MQDDITVVYYTSNNLEKENPYFVMHTKQNLVKAIGDLPLLVVSLEPMGKEDFPGYKGEYKNLVAGRDFTPYKPGRHHFNIYYQIMIGAKNAKTKFVAMAEDDIFYSHDHFHSRQFYADYEKNGDMMYYDMNKVSLFTWTKPPMFSFRSKRMVVNQLIAPAKLLADAMQERFDRIPILHEKGWEDERIMKFWGDPGRYENHLGVTVQKRHPFFCEVPSVVWTHPKAYGFLNHGTRKKLGDLKITELYDWGKASDMLKLWGNQPIR